jgi:AcrR family transcriptional regulator
MPRVCGQIDQVKSEAIFDAAADVLAERGLGASISAIASRAGVSKQTIYNQFGSKTELIHALVARRVASVTAPLRVPGAAENPEETLTALATTLIAIVTNAKAYALMRLTVQGAGAMPDLARAVFEAGPSRTRALLAQFLKAETLAGRLDVADPLEAAEMFAGMCAGHRQIRTLLGLDLGEDASEIDRLARNIAQMFMRAFAPAGSDKKA